MKGNFKRILALALALTVLLGAGIVPVGAEDGVTIKLHYNRPDGVYDDWSVWFWNAGAEGKDIPFAQENGEMVATFPVAPGATSVGFIVKLPNWAAKDVNMDQFIDVAAYLSGTVHVYVQSGVEGYELKLGEDIVSGIKVRSATYMEGRGIVVALTGAIDPESLTVTGPEGTVAIASRETQDTVYTLVPQEALDLYGTYTLRFNGEEYPVAMPNVYSTQAFEEEFTYTGDDLGAVWTAEQTSFRLWAPTAKGVQVKLYASGDPGAQDLLEQIPMEKSENGTWVARKEGDLNGTYYTYAVEVEGQVVEACDPYARATGVNGQRAMVIDLDGTDPEGWDTDKDPHADQEITDAVIYELHVRDLSVDANSGIEHKGKFLGLIEEGTRSPDGIPTGLDHIKNLGVTHIHLLPVYDYGSVDETKLDTPQFNWGYDPVNYNVPEGSYSTDPYHGQVRVKEMKQMVKGLHDNGISVIMDVVYNHVYNGGAFCFNQIVPEYFSRVNDNGSWSNGSGCGNDTASERSMVKKYIVDSVKYWADEYHIDGFRFDLVGLIDTETVNAIVEEVHKTHPNVIFYGEGWTMSTDVTKEGYTMATQVNSALTPGFAYFSDNIRDAIKGSVFDNTGTGYVSGNSVQMGGVASSFVAKPGWTVEPTQIINYSSCHDNMTLFDRLVNSTPNATRADQIKMNNLAASIVLTAQGVPFIHAGEEMLRSKPLGDGTFDHNSYSSSDQVNNLKWADLSMGEYQQVYGYYQGLIALRKANPGLRLTTSQDVAQYVSRIQAVDGHGLGFLIGAGARGQENDLVVLFNPDGTAINATIPAGTWTIYASGDQAGTESLGTISGAEALVVEVAPISAMVLARTGEAPVVPETTEGAPEPTEPAQQPAGNGIPWGLIAGGVVLVIGLIVLVSRKRKG